MTNAQQNTQTNEVLGRYKQVTVVVAGVIGISWTALFLAHGLSVTVNDPRPDLEHAVLDGLKQFTPTLKELGLPTGNMTMNLRVEAESWPRSRRPMEIIGRSTL